MKRSAILLTAGLLIWTCKSFTRMQDLNDLRNALPASQAVNAQVLYLPAYPNFSPPLPPEFPPASPTYVLEYQDTPQNAWPNNCQDWPDPIPAEVSPPIPRHFN